MAKKSKNALDFYPKGTKKKKSKKTKGGFHG